MGKAIIVPNVDWSNNNLGQVTASVLAISGSSNVNISGEFSAILGGNLVNAQWSISDNTIASLSSNLGNTITVTVLQNGTATLSATYNGETAELVLICNAGYITEADFTQDMCHYYASNAYGANSRTVLVFDIADASTFHGSLTNNSATIKAAVQLWDSGQLIPSSDRDSPSLGTTPVPTHTVWDSGWKTQNQTQSFDSTCNKNNSVGTAQSSNPPARACLVCTYVSGGTGMPPLEEIKAAVTFKYYAK